MTFQQEMKTNPLALSLLLFALFSLLTYLGNFRQLWLGLAVLGMLALPPLWAWRAGDWPGLGFRTDNLGSAVRWGVAGGLLSAGVGVLVIGRVQIPSDLPRQLTVAVPMWLLVAGPFQEFFFRGWLLSRLASALGPWPGLLIALACFTLWHFTLPIFGPQSTFHYFPTRQPVWKTSILS